LLAFICAAIPMRKAGQLLLKMNKWHFIAIGVGLAAGYFYLGTSATDDIDVFNSIYRSGNSAGS